MWQIFLWVVTSLISYALTPKPKAPAPGKVEIPSAEEGRKIGVLFGGRWIRNPHVFWWGDVRTTPIKSKGGKK